MTETTALGTVRLQVARARREDSGRESARVARRAFEKLDLEVGDVVEMHGDRVSALRVRPPLSEDRVIDIVRLDGLQRANVGAGIGEFVTLRKIDPPTATAIRLRPADLRSAVLTETLPTSWLLDRPLTKGDVVSVVQSPDRAASDSVGSYPRLGELRYVVAETKPNGVVIVGAATRIELGGLSAAPAEGERGRASPRPSVRPLSVGVTYDDLGGLGNAVSQIREMVELPLKHPELFRSLGVEPPRGVLLHGPPGTGKTLLARAVANEAGVGFLHVAGPEIMGSLYGESEQRLRDTFRAAREQSPAIVFIDEIDSIAPSREDVRGDVERRVVAQLLTLMDGLDTPEGVMVLAATNRVDALDEALRRPGRFDREVAVGAPDGAGRLEILRIHTRGMPLEHVELDALAGSTHGFVGADLAALVREAVMEALRRGLDGVDPRDDEAVTGLVGNLRITGADFRAARSRVSPSALREIHVEVANVRWADVGGLESVKQTLREGIELPLRRPDAFRRLGIRPPRGFLLFGPPGTGKTLIGRAVAGEAEANFILVKASSVLSRWYGASERHVARIFGRARQVAPAVVFIDEIDALAPERRASPGEPLVSERVVNTFLSEMDGVESGEGVVVIGATNRPLRLDPALLRPGRFDELIYVPIPDMAARLHILGVHTRGMPLGADVRLEALAERTEGCTGADLEDLVRRAGLRALREAPEVESIPARCFEAALDETRPSVTSDVAEEYGKVARTLKERSVRLVDRIGF